jgi:hypothetical protein
MSRLARHYLLLSNAEISEMSARCIATTRPTIPVGAPVMAGGFRRHDPHAGRRDILAEYVDGWRSLTTIQNVNFVLSATT